MKKVSIMTSAAMLMISQNVFSNENDNVIYENWVGGYANYHIADSDKPAPSGSFDDGKGFGGELGFRFDSSWAIRFELQRLLINGDTPATLDEDGTQQGVDALYFLEDDVAYLFGGIKVQSLEDSYRVANVGIGKHWPVAENWKVITELASYYDFGQGYNDFSVKLGVAYLFGETSKSFTSRPVVELDSDNDGVKDALDRCPSTPAGVSVDETGCNIDVDGDGVLNSVDQCPNTPVNTEVDAVGCAIIGDIDADGVNDNDDICPNTPSTDKVDSKGCSILQESEVSVSLDLLFANNSSEIGNTDAPSIIEFVTFMKRFPNTKAVIEGHTSAVGDATYNQMLSEKRAQSVVDLLINEYGLDAERLSAVGYGESRLKYTENTSEANRLNRRIEAKVSTIVQETVSK